MKLPAAPWCSPWPRRWVKEGAAPDGLAGGRVAPEAFLGAERFGPRR